MSKYNRRLELLSKQVTGAQEGEGGVYVRLLVDKDLKATFDLRYFGYDLKRARYRETKKGLIFDMVQVEGIINALQALREEARTRGLT